jgi:hypothetical protein
VTEITERIERRYQQVARQQNDADFLRQARGYVNAIAEERPARRILSRLHAEAKAGADRFNATEEELVAEAVGIRQRLAAEAPEIDNSSALEPDFASRAYGEWQLGSLASFDRLALHIKRIEFPLLPYYDPGDKTPLGTMLIILRGRLRAAQFGEDAGILAQAPNRRPDLDDFGRQIHNVSEKHAHALKAFREAGKTLPGLADERLQAIFEELEPEPFVIAEGEGEDAIAERALLRGVQQLGIIGLMRSALAGLQLNPGEQAVLTDAITFLRADVERLQDELIYRLGRGDGESKRRRFLLFIGRGSFRVGVFIVGAVATAIIGILVGSYFAK